MKRLEIGLLLIDNVGVKEAEAFVVDFRTIKGGKPVREASVVINKYFRKQARTTPSSSQQQKARVRSSP